MSWRYTIAHRLSFVGLVLSVVMMILLPWTRPDKNGSKQDNE